MWSSGIPSRFDVSCTPNGITARFWKIPFHKKRRRSETLLRHFYRFVSESPCRKSSSANSAPLAKAAIALTTAAQEIILRPAESRRAEALRLPAGSPEHTRSFISPRFIQNCNYGSSSLYLALIKALFNFLRRKAVGQQVINIFRQIPECTCNIFEFPDIAVRAEYARMIGVEIQREIG